MKGREPSLADRTETAAKARQAQLERARAKSPANDPGFAARQAARMEVARAREERLALRKAEEIAKAEADKILRAQEEVARLEREKIAAAEEAAQEVLRAAAREEEYQRDVVEREAADIAAKEARDLRYAARKARKARGK